MVVTNYSLPGRVPYVENPQLPKCSLNGMRAGNTATVYFAVRRDICLRGVVNGTVAVIFKYNVGQEQLTGILHVIG